MLSNNLKKYFLPLLLIVSVAISFIKPPGDNLENVAGKIQGQLNNAERIFSIQSADSVLPGLTTDNSEVFPQVENVEDNGILLYYYSNDSLTHWTSNSVLPLTLPSALHSGTSFLKLKNGWYQAMKVYDTLTKEALVGLLPVKYEYPFENKFLKNDFAFNFEVANNIEISDKKSPGSVPIKSISGNTLFNLYISADEKDDNINWALLLAHLTALLIMLYYIQFFSAHLIQIKGFAIGLSVLVVSVFAIRAFMLWYDPYSELSKLELFSPKYYASSIITKSLGDLIINTFLFVWVILFAIYHKKKWSSAVRKSVWICWFLLLAVSVYTVFITWLFKTLVLDSVISFEVYNVFNLNLYSLLGLVCIALLLISHFLIARTAILFFIDKKIKPAYIVLFVSVIAICFLLYSASSKLSGVIAFSVVWNIGYILVIYAVLRKDVTLSVRNLIIYISLYGVLSTFLIENLYERKERNQRQFFASRLVTERDFVAEYMFDDVASRISDDPVIKNYFKTQLISKKEITARLSSLYLSGYLNKYDLKVNTYDKHGNPQKNKDTLSLKYFYAQADTDSVRLGQLYYINDTSENYSYLSFFKFREDSSHSGELVLQLFPKVYYGQNVYPELLLGENVSTMLDDSRYNYAIYRNDKLINEHGDFPYSYYWSKGFEFEDKQPYRFIDVGEWEHIIYKFSNDMKVIVSIKHERLFEPVATFSYLFTFYFILVVTGLILFRSSTNWPSYSNALIGQAFSFRTRINYSMLMMIVTSFIIIGFITISFFSKQYNNFYTDRLVRKEKVLQASLEYFIQQNIQGSDTIFNERLNNILSFEVARLAEINDIDINLYDPDGNLTVESQPAIYDKGLVSKKMNPNAYFELSTSKSAQITEQENIGELKYLATYSPIRNASGVAIAYLGIPYFERSKNVTDEVSSFLVALMNVYVFIFICAAILAYFISNSITNPLTIISEKLRLFNLNKRNEPIEWKSNDEIGILVGEYNKMIKELEQSAQKLARSERESAWREMAKQIAHEIKNPLTPMKLSIQHLQRAINNKDSNINELAKKVTHTLEEQIENLASIATAFSSFAKMPKAQNEVINLNDLLKSIVDLFNSEGTAAISFNSEMNAPLVFADKNQLVSVFNNLVKNAIQSIPENREGLIDIELTNEGEWIKIAVHDNGAGIPIDNYEKVFVPNFTTKSSGTGLGLAISKQISEGAGGEIWFESKQNVGSSFYVQLRKHQVA